MNEERLPLPISPDEAVDGTFDCKCAVLVVARTRTSAGRLLEALRFFRNDFRVKLLFTVDESSPHSVGVADFLRSERIERIIPWREVPNLSYALAISASENVDFDAVKGKAIVLPHGIGFNKYVPDRAGGTRLAGVPAREVLRTGRVRVMLGHSDQAEQLRAEYPEIEGHTDVVGDPTYDALVSCAPLRDRYRRNLGLDGRRLVLISSTWGNESATGRWGRLATELLAALPADEYRVALALHPNVWTWYSSKQIETWFADALEAGLLLVPRTQGWQAMLLAADQVIADHGSLGLYSAALGKPLLLAAFGEEAVPGTPVERLGKLARRLDPAGDLKAQLDHAYATHDPRELAEFTEGLFEYVGAATERLRTVLYRELDLDPPDAELPLLRIPDVEPYDYPATSYRVGTEFDPDGGLTVWRLPRAAGRTGTDFGTRRHLVVDEEELLLPRRYEAAVLTCSAATPVDDALGWTERTLHDFPGALVAVAATPDGCVARVRDLHLVWLSGTTDAMLAGSAVYACAVADELRDRTLSVRAGVHRHELELRLD